MAESAMRLMHDDLVTHMPHARRPETIYHLHLYVPTEPIGRLPVAVATEVFSNPGKSITNCCAELAAGAMAYLWAKGFHFEALHWIEHYDEAISYGINSSRQDEQIASSPGDEEPEHFALVAFEPGNEQRYGRFALRNPQWRHCTLQEVEALIGMSWQPVQITGLPQEPEPREPREPKEYKS